MTKKDFNAIALVMMMNKPTGGNAKLTWELILNGLVRYLTNTYPRFNAETFRKASGA